MTVEVDGQPHAHRGPGKSSPSAKKLISGKYAEQPRPAVVSLMPAVFNPVSYSLPPHHQQLPLDNFHRNDSLLASIIFHNQTSQEAMKSRDLLLT